MVSLQGRVSPIVDKVRSMVQQGKIGKVMSSSVEGALGSLMSLSLVLELKYFTERSVGGNMVTIGFGHSE